jgi:alpha-amylase
MLNGVMLQGFHWYTTGDGSHWDALAKRAKDLASAGVTAVWMPPAYKGFGGAGDVGYGVYDMYDLGEFDQKGGVRTKYGTRKQYLAAVVALRKAGVHAYADTVFNHRMGADAVESVLATPFPQDDRTRSRGEIREIQAWTRFDFVGRAGKHSQFQWNHTHFDAVDYDHARPSEHGTVYLLEGKQFDDQVALENGNYAYLMGCDLDCQSAEVRAELEAWGKWYLDTTGVNGFRLDAVKHISAWFFPQWIDAMEKHSGKDLFVVGEYWQQDSQALNYYLDRMQGRMSIFDVVLHYHFHQISRSYGQYDMRRILNGTLMKERPMNAVTFVDNHDSQPLQALESVVEPWFKPLAYAFILLREAGYPCIFDPDYTGSVYTDKGRDGNQVTIQMASHQFLLDRFLWARHTCGYGTQIDYIDHWNRIGWTRLGNTEFPRAMAVLLSDGPGGTKWMNVGRPQGSFIDITGHDKQAIVANADGWAEFRTPAGSISVWIEDDGKQAWPKGFVVQ